MNFFLPTKCYQEIEHIKQLSRATQSQAVTGISFFPHENPWTQAAPCFTRGKLRHRAAIGSVSYHTDSPAPTWVLAHSRRSVSTGWIVTLGGADRLRLVISVSLHTDRFLKRLRGWGGRAGAATAERSPNCLGFEFVSFERV